jgi:hypothetical protein
MWIRTVQQYLVWAVAYNQDVAISPIKDKEQVEVDKYLGKADRLWREGLNESVDSIWYSIPDRDRDLMIKLWLTRPTFGFRLLTPCQQSMKG